MGIPTGENPLRDFATSGDLISDELISVPASSPFQKYPEFTPQKNTTSTVQIWTSPSLAGTKYSEKTDESLVSASGDFFVNYNRGGYLTFHQSAANMSLYMTYHEIGTFLRVKHMNDLRNVVGSGDVADAGGHVNLVSHANDATLHGTSSGDIVDIERHSGDPGAHSNYAYKPGRHGGQILKGGINNAEDLTLQSTDGAVKGRILLSSGSGFDEANTRFGIGTPAPATTLHMSGDVAQEVRAESNSSWAGLVLKPAGAGSSDSVYAWVAQDEKLLRLRVGGIDRFKILPSGGQVGIGNDITPVAMLDVSGDVHFKSEIGLAGNPSIIRSSGDLNLNPIGQVTVNAPLQMNKFYLPVAPSGGYVLMSDSSGGGTWQPNTTGGGGGIIIPPGGGEIDDYVVLLLHYNGEDGSTTFTDSSKLNHSVTPNGNIQIDTSQYKFKGASGLFDGSGDFLSLSDNVSWSFGALDFTIDFWVRFNSLVMPAGGAQVFMSQNPQNDRAWSFLYRESDTSLVFSYSTDGTTAIEKKVAWSPSIGIWYHLAVVRNSSNLRFFVNGTQQGATLNVWADVISDSSSVLYVGENPLDRDYYLNGWMDELRVSKGIARWTYDFTPPVNEYGTVTVGDATIIKKLYLPLMSNGSILFISGASGEVSEDNSNFFWDNSNNRLGIRTTIPIYPLDVSGDAKIFGDLRISGDIISGGDFNVYGTNNYYRAEGQALMGWDGTYSGVRFGTTQNFPIIFFSNSATPRMYVSVNGGVGIGTTTEFGGGAGVIGLANAITNPTANPTGGGVIYASGDQLYWRDSSGNVRLLSHA